MSCARALAVVLSMSVVDAQHVAYVKIEREALPLALVHLVIQIRMRSVSNTCTNAMDVGPIEGRKTVDEVMTQLLESTGCQYKWVGPNSIDVFPLKEEI